MNKKMKNAINDCDVIFANLEDMMSEESTKKYIKSYKIIRNCIYNISELIENNEEDIDYSIHDVFEDLKNIMGDK